MFADDTNLFVNGKTLAETTVIANICIPVNELNSWFLANGLTLNLDKTCYSVFGVRDVCINTELKIGTAVLKRVTSCKYLGVIIDDKLSWQEHIDSVYIKIIKFTSIFY